MRAKAALIIGAVVLTVIVLAAIVMTLKKHGAAKAQRINEPGPLQVAPISPAGPRAPLQPGTLSAPPSSAEPVAPSAAQSATPPASASEALPDDVVPATADAAGPAGLDLAPFRDVSRPLAAREDDIRTLARRGDALSLATLMALGDDDSYLNWVAVEALGGARRSDAAVAYLKEKLRAATPRMIASAARALARMSGEEAVPDLAALIVANRTRQDGYEDDVRAEAVKALGEIAHESGTPILTSEIDRMLADKNWSLEYGAVVIAALGRLATPTAHDAMRRYAAALAAKKPDDPLARRYFEEKIAETEAAIGGDIPATIFERKLK